MSVSQCQTALMCLKPSHPWRDTPVGQVQALTAKKTPPSYNIHGVLLSAFTNELLSIALMTMVIHLICSGLNI